MAPRLNKTLADYIGIAISPALIMVMVGSLVFFLVEVFYQGQYGERLHFILALFVMAIVLVARLSIEFGSEHATLYGIPLAIVTVLALAKFVDRGLIINVGLMAIIWWSAHKLTWDCTLIDETEDASGEGLLQSAGLEEAAEDAHGSSPDARKGLWQRMRERFSSKGPHAPGVWIVYFSLAALPLFAIGELCLPKDDPGRRQYAFRLLFFYVSSGLALLTMTTFLGLRRYLRQRSLQMPAAMARWWIAVGGGLVAALVVLAALLPRPAADYESSNIRLVFDSPDQEPSDHAMLGGEGAEGEGPSGETRQEGDAEQTGAATGGERQEGSPGKPPKSPESGQSGSADGKQSAQQPSEGQSESQSGKPAEAGKQSDPAQKGASPDEQRTDGDGNASQRQESSGREPSKSPEGGGRSQQSDAKSQPDSKQGRDSGEKSESGADHGQKPSRSTSKDIRPADRHERRPRQTNQQKAAGDEQQSAEEEREPESQQPQSPTVPRDSSPSPLTIPRLDLGSGWWVTLLRWLLYAVLAAVAFVWAWRNRELVRAALAGMRQALADLWNWLFGGRKPEEQPVEPEPLANAPSKPRFAAFDDPFATGAVRRMPPDELVRYTFEALEAWARDQGYPREPDQTPHEFAREIAARAPQLGRDTRRLAELYNQVAYAPGTLAASRVSPLEDLWRGLRQSEASVSPK